MSRLFLIVVAVFASTILLAQIVSSAEGKYSEARKLAKEKTVKLAAEKEVAKKAKLTKEKKELEPKTITTTATSTTSSTKTSAEVKNTAKAKAISDAKTALELAKSKYDAAKKAYKNNPSSATAGQAVEDARTAEKKAEIELKLARFD